MKISRFFFVHTLPCSSRRPLCLVAEASTMPHAEASTFSIVTTRYEHIGDIGERAAKTGEEAKHQHCHFNYVLRQECERTRVVWTGEETC